MSELFKPGQITQFQLEFDLDLVIALLPVDGTDGDDALATSEIFGLAGNPLVVTVDALGDRDAVIVVDQMPGNENDHMRAMVSHIINNLTVCWKTVYPGNIENIKEPVRQRVISFRRAVIL